MNESQRLKAALIVKTERTIKDFQQLLDRLTCKPQPPLAPALNPCDDIYNAWQDALELRNDYWAAGAAANDLGNSQDSIAGLLEIDWYNCIAPLTASTPIAPLKPT